MGRLHETATLHEVPFHDVDAMGIVWHGNYYKYFELGRTTLLRSRELDVGDLIGPRYRFVVIESKCRYVSPLFYADEIQIRAWFKDTRHRLLIGYEITNLTRGRRSAKGHTAMATLDTNGRLLLDTPDEILERIR